MSDADQTLAQSEQDLAEGRQQSQAEGAPVLPGYRLEHRLGAGTFGTVWSGVQLRTGQRVAVKVLHAAHLDLTGFRREVERLREVSEHPHVVTLLDADLGHDPPFFVMPWLTRGSLAGVKQPSVGQATAWLEQIAEGLQFTHEKGLLHCDLKPSNLLLDEEGRIRLVDFGQAYARGEARGALGTLGFMAPEQALLGSEQAGSSPGARWDVYALGATLYYLLSGRCPRLSEEQRTALSTLHSAAALQAYRQHLEQNPLLPLRRLNPAVDRDLAAIIEACLALDPNDRTPTAAQVLQDLELRRRGEPLLCRRPWSLGYRLARLVRKPAVAVALVFLLALSALAAVSYQRIVRSNLALKASEQRSEDLVVQLMTDRGLTAEQQGDPSQACLWWAAALVRRPEDERLRLLLATHPLDRLVWRQKIGENPGLTIFSPDGERLLVSQNLNTRLLERATGKELAALPTGVSRAAFSPDGKLLITFDDGLEVRVLPDGKPLNLPVHDRVAAWTFREGELVTLERTGRLAFWQLPAGRLREERELEPCDDASFSGDQVALISSQGLSLRGLDGRKLGGARHGYTSWNAVSPQASRAVLGPTWLELPSGKTLTAPWGTLAISHPVFSPDGRFLAVGAEGGQLKVYACQDGAELASVSAGSQVSRLVFSGHSLWAGTEAGTVLRLGLPGGKVEARLQLGDRLRDLAVSPDGRWLAATTLSGVELREVRRFAPRLELQLDHLARGLTFTPDSRLLAASRHTLLELDQERLRPLARLQGAELDLLQTNGLEVAVNAERWGLLYSLKAEKTVFESPRGPLVLGPDGFLVLEGGGELHRDGRTKILNRNVEALWGAFSHQGDRLALSMRTNPRAGGQLQVWSGDGFQLLSVLTLPSHALWPAWSPDGKWLACTSEQGELGVWDRGGKSVLARKLGPGPGNFPVFSPDGRLAVSCEDGLVHVLELPGGKEAFPALPHPSGLVTAAWQGGRLVTCAHSSGQVRVWDGDTGTPLTPWIAAGPGAFAALSPDAKTLATAGSDRLQLWELTFDPVLSPAALQAEVEQAAGMQLDPTSFTMRSKSSVGGP